MIKMQRPDCKAAATLARLWFWTCDGNTGIRVLTLSGARGDWVFRSATLRGKPINLAKFLGICLATNLGIFSKMRAVPFRPLAFVYLRLCGIRYLPIARLAFLARGTRLIFRIMFGFRAARIAKCFVFH